MRVDKELESAIKTSFATHDSADSLTSRLAILQSCLQSCQFSPRFSERPDKVINSNMIRNTARARHHVDIKAIIAVISQYIKNTY